MEVPKRKSKRWIWWVLTGGIGLLMLCTMMLFVAALGSNSNRAQSPALPTLAEPTQTLRVVLPTSAFPTKVVASPVPAKVVEPTATNAYDTKYLEFKQWLMVWQPTIQKYVNEFSEFNDDVQVAVQDQDVFFSVEFMDKTNGHLTNLLNYSDLLRRSKCPDERIAAGFDDLHNATSSLFKNMSYGLMFKSVTYIKAATANVQEIGAVMDRMTGYLSDYR